MRTLDGFIRAGKINYYGLSNFTGWQLTKAIYLAGAMNLAEPVTLQPQYSLIVREIEWEIVPALPGRRDGHAAVEPTGRRLAFRQVLGVIKSQRATPAWATTRTAAWRPTTVAAPTVPGQIIDAVQTVAEGRGVSMAEVALAWVTDRPGVTSTILGARTSEQLATNLKASDLHLSAEETAALDKASDLGAADYPYGQMGAQQRERELNGR